MAPPSLELPDDLRRLLARRGDGALRRAEEFLKSAPRACSYVKSERVASAPLRRGWLGPRLGRSPAAPVLDPLASKLGGRPYDEACAGTRWGGFRFLGQLNFADIGEPPPDAPREGILALDVGGTTAGFRLRWYPHPDATRALGAEAAESVGSWEARLHFEAGWSLPGGKAWRAALPDDDRDADRELWSAWNAWSAPGFLEDERRGLHRVLGHRAGGLDEHYGFTAPSGRSDDVDDHYEMLWRITSDAAASFGWGTNWIYVIIHRDDLAALRLDRAVVTGANA